jgi:Domain of unknown function (DUF4365)
MVRDEDAPRRTGNRAVNRARTFFEENDLIFEEVDLRNDIGVDAILTLARSGLNAGLSIRLQIKGGRKYKRQRHIEERHRFMGYASFRSSDWNLALTPSRGFEGHHVIDIDTRLRDIWRNSRPMYVIVQDPDDGELYFGNLARMADVLPLDQDLVKTYERSSPNAHDDSPRLLRYLTRLHTNISHLSEDELRHYKTWMPLYPDLRVTPDGLDRFLEAARAEARQPIPDPTYPATGEIPTFVNYPDGTIGLSREALDMIRRREQEGM